MNTPTGANSEINRRRMLASLGESTSAMLSWESMRGNFPNVNSTTSNISLPVHNHPNEEFSQRLRRSPSRKQPSLELLVEGHSRKFLSPAKPRKTTSLANLRRNPNWSSVTATSPPQEICLPAIDDHHCIPSIVSIPSRCRQNNKRNTIEVGNGNFLTLVGAKETVDALRNNHYTNTTCFVCQTFLYCAGNVSSVVCPECRSINPIDANMLLSSSSSTRNDDETESLVGLGLTVEHVSEELRVLGQPRCFSLEDRNRSAP